MSNRTQEELNRLYLEMYRLMIKKDISALDAILDDAFRLVHMTGMQQDKQSFLHAIENGTLNYYAAIQETTDSTIQNATADFVGKSRVTASVFGGGTHTWRLQLRIQFMNRGGNWMIGRTVASTY